MVQSIRAKSEVFGRRKRGKVRLTPTPREKVNFTVIASVES